MDANYIEPLVKSIENVFATMLQTRVMAHPQTSETSDPPDCDVSGIIGMAAFVILIGGTLILIGKRRSPLAIAAGGVMVVALAQGLFDIFWVGGLQVVAWIIIGMSAAIDDSTARDGERGVESARESIQ